MRRRSIVSALLFAGLFPTNDAFADYLNLSAGAMANPQTNISLSWDGIPGRNYHVKWKPSSSGTWGSITPVDETTPGLIVGSGSRWYYAVGGLTCNTKYDFEVKMVGRGWSSTKAPTGACPLPPGAECQIAASNLVYDTANNRVFFIATDKRVYNHWVKAGQWQLNALSYAANAANAASNLVYDTKNNRVFFIGTDNRVYNYWINGGQWQLDWLGPTANAASNLVYDTANNRVFFIGTDKRVWNYWWNNGWQLNALSYAANAANAASNLVYDTTNNRVFYIGTDKRVWNYWWSNGWQLNALSYAASAANAASNLAYDTTNNRVFYIGTDKRVYNYWLSGGQWQLNWLCID
jgi:hypothetical protein